MTQEAYEGITQNAHTKMGIPICSKLIIIIIIIIINMSNEIELRSIVP